MPSLAEVFVELALDSTRFDSDLARAREELAALESERPASTDSSPDANLATSSAGPSTSSTSLNPAASPAADRQDLDQQRNELLRRIDASLDRLVQLAQQTKPGVLG